MRQILERHPDSPAGPASEVAVTWARPAPGVLALDYVLSGAMERLVLPPPAPPARADELWRRTCFEAFVQPAPGEAYYEFNLAPSGLWAAYRFDRYRSGMRSAEHIGAPRIEVRATGQSVELKAWLDLTQTPELAQAASWRLGLSAVVEAAGGEVSYWALAHPPGRADFQHPDCFALESPATERP